MYEYLGEAIILDKERVNDANTRVVAFMKRYGKVVAYVRSARKITSKLASHLEPGMHSRLRIIEQNSTQVVDALKISRLNTPPVHLFLLANLLTDREPDMRLWHDLERNQYDWKQILRWLGWDPSGARCVHCNAARIHMFQPEDQSFLCKSCVAKRGRNTVSYKSDVSFT